MNFEEGENPNKSAHHQIFLIIFKNILINYPKYPYQLSILDLKTADEPFTQLKKTTKIYSINYQ